MTTAAAPARLQAAPGLHSPPVDYGGSRGTRMDTTQVLDVIERLHVAARHPDIARVEQYGHSVAQSPAGVAVTYQSGAKAFVWAVVGRPKTEPVDLPAELGEYRFRASHALKFLIDLLETARPAGMSGWRTIAFEGVAQRPSGLEVNTDGGPVVLRVTSGGAPGPDSDPESWAGYTIPEEVSSCLQP